jgi:hypothetical protein
MAVRASRRLPTPPAPKSGSACNSLRSNSRRFLSDFGTGDVAPSTGIHVKSSFKSNGNGNGNGRCAEPQATATVAARARATATECGPPATINESAPSLPFAP